VCRDDRLFWRRQSTLAIADAFFWRMLVSASGQGGVAGVIGIGGFGQDAAVGRGMVMSDPADGCTVPVRPWL
jgi:hypothetical protein